MLKPDTLLQNRYNIIRHVGQGGMGAVYEASDQRLGNTVALKQMLLPSVESPPTDAIHSSMRRAFEREARILASLRHSALPRVIDHFADPVGQFLLMEFIPGPDIGALHKERGGPFDLDTVLLWADQLLDALDYLHTQIPPVIHRDIKPQNLKPGPRGQLILLDFGLAKGLARAQAQSTTGDSLMGYTPQYAPLEQIEGGSVDVRSDLYSLAATLYHLVTNAPPADALQRATALLQGRTDPLRPAHEIVSGLPRAISAVLTHGLAMNPEARPDSAATMQGRSVSFKFWGLMSRWTTVGVRVCR